MTIDEQKIKFDENPEKIPAQLLETKKELPLNNEIISEKEIEKK
jgi:hypothetical protein